MSDETLPDCMMPDGAQPCIGFTQLEAKTRVIATIAADVRLIPSARLAAIVLTLHGGWLTRIDIANRCGVHDRTISRIIARLESWEWWSPIGRKVRRCEFADGKETHDDCQDHPIVRWLPRSRRPAQATPTLAAHIAPRAGRKLLHRMTRKDQANDQSTTRRM